MPFSGVKVSCDSVVSKVYFMSSDFRASRKDCLVRGFHLQRGGIFAGSQCHLLLVDLCPFSIYTAMGNGRIGKGKIDQLEVPPPY